MCSNDENNQKTRGHIDSDGTNCNNKTRRGHARHFRLLGLTGGIGAGKSLVSDYLRRLGYTVFDADEVAREAAEVGQPALAALAAAFGAGILHGDGSLNRAALAAIAFSDGERVSALNRIMHADIGERLDALIEGHSARLTEEKPVMVTGVISAKKGAERENGAVLAKRDAQEGTGRKRETVFLVAPLLFEAGLDRKCDRVWLVAAEEGLRLRRAATRDGTAEAAIRRRAAQQWAESERRARADVILENDGDIPALYGKVDRLLAAEREGLCW